MNHKFDHSPLLKEVIAILRARAAVIRIKNENLAINSGLSKSQLSKIFHEHQIPTLDQLDVLCLHLGLNIQDVISEACAKHPQRFEQKSNKESYNTIIESINHRGF